MKGVLNKINGYWVVEYNSTVHKLQHLHLNPMDELLPGSYYPLKIGKEVEFYGQMSSHSEFEQVATLIKPENLPSKGEFLPNIDQSDVEHLEWIYQRMLYSNNENLDYMLRFKKIINKLQNNG